VMLLRPPRYITKINVKHVYIFIVTDLKEPPSLAIMSPEALLELMGQWESHIKWHVRLAPRRFTEMRQAFGTFPSCG
jgi:hypothetical protein